MTVAAALTEAQEKILEELRNGYTPSFVPLTPEELMREAEEEDAGRGVSMTIEEVRAIADALRS